MPAVRAERTILISSHVFIVKRPFPTLYRCRSTQRNTQPCFRCRSVGYRSLFGAEGLHGLDSGGSAGGKRCGQQHSDEDESCGCGEGDGVVERDAVQLAAEVAREKTDAWK